MGAKGYKTVASSLLLVLLLLAGCKKDKPADVVQPPAADSADKMYIVCEGSLGNGNSSLDMYDLSSGTVYSDIYKSANDAELGDVFQSMERIGERLFLCINNSDKIVVLNAADHKRVGEIAVSKPRYILPLGGDKAYVSSIFGNTVHIINTSTLQVTGSIRLPSQNPEGMLLHQDKVYICAWDTNTSKVFVVNPQTDVVGGEIMVGGRAPQSILADREGMLWVLSGNVPKGIPAALTRMDAAGNVLRTYAFPEGADAIRPVMNEAGDMIYFIEVNQSGSTEHNGIYRMAIDAEAVPDKAFIQTGKFQYFWALALDDKSQVFVGDPKGFVQKGSVSIYDTEGNKKSEFQTGVGPGRFYFD